ncbi:acyltransferase family protein [Pseudanabaena minima]|uniref:acyltransferase family protein n=1 Tax=Pseudanabaena minima TaxID=890415 RepID=UPI003DA83B00
MILPQVNWNTRFAPANDNPQKAKFEPALEGLRGLAAIWVFYSHAISSSYGLDQGYKPLAIFGGGLDAVLIFFIMSGYVIGITNTDSFSGAKANLYLLRRAVRLLPMYLLAIAFSYLVSPIDSWQTVLGNIFFLQNLVVPIISGNGPLWSLNYEFFYYLAFLAIWRFRPKIMPIMIGVVIIVFVGTVFRGFPSILVSYLTGWFFWLFGLWLAWRVPSQNREVSVPLLSAILVLLATSELHLGGTLFTVLKLNNSGTLGLLSLGDVVSLPACISLFILVVNRPIQSNAARLIGALAFLMPFSAICYGVFLKKGGLGSENWIAAAIEIALAIALFWFRLSPSILNRFAFFGSISYGIYIFHAPFIFFIRNYFPSSVSGTIWTFILRLILLSIFTLVLSYLMELKIQPKIKTWFQRNIVVRFKTNN